MDNCTFNSNSFTNALTIEGGFGSGYGNGAFITNSKFLNNIGVSADGGNAIWNDNSDLLIDNCHFVNNTPVQATNGGAVLIYHKLHCMCPIILFFLFHSYRYYKKIYFLWKFSTFWIWSLYHW